MVTDGMAVDVERAEAGVRSRPARPTDRPTDRTALCLPYCTRQARPCKHGDAPGRPQQPSAAKGTVQELARPALSPPRHRSSATRARRARASHTPLASLPAPAVAITASETAEHGEDGSPTCGFGLGYPSSQRVRAQGVPFAVGTFHVPRGREMRGDVRYGAARSVLRCAVTRREAWRGRGAGAGAEEDRGYSTCCAACAVEYVQSYSSVGSGHWLVWGGSALLCWTEA